MRLVLLVAVVGVLVAHVQAVPPRVQALVYGVDPKDANAIKAAKWAVGQLNTKANVTGKPLTLQKIVSGQAPGSNFYLTIAVQTAAGANETYTVSVLTKPSYQLSGYGKYLPQNSAANKAGGASPGAVTPAATAAAQWAVTQLNTKPDVSGKPLTFVKVLTVKTQVVAGINYLMTVQVSDAAKRLQVYNVTVWSKPAGYQGNSQQPNYELTNYGLVRLDTAITQPLAGGVGPASVTPAATAAAQWAVTQLNTKADVAGKPLTFVKVVSVKTQVVAGINYFLTIQVSNTSKQPHTYNVTMWSKPLGYQGNSQQPNYELTAYKKV